MPVTSKSNEIKIIREFDAPLKMVWDAWADPEKVAKWWGPRGFTITTHSKDLRPGGMWHYTMHGPEGVEYVNKSQYFEVEEFKKLVYDHGGNDEQKPLFRVTVLFSESHGKTIMDMTMTLPTPEAAEQTRGFIRKASGDSTWDRLAEYLDHQSLNKETFVINRTFDAPIDLMFKVWSEPDHFAKWLAPKGFDMTFIRADIREGGSSFYYMSAANGQGKMYGRCEYLKLEEPNHIVYKQQFCDENENITRHPMSSTWPETMLTDVKFTSEGPDKTRVTITWEPSGITTQEEMDTFVNARAGMTQGWTGSFDKLEDYLAQR